VFAPRVAATLAVRLLRRLPAGQERALDALQGALDGLGRRWPRRLGCFVAVRAVKPGPTPGRGP
jgi:hypothetical protein